jgi:hypothetical protein
LGCEKDRGRHSYSGREEAPVVSLKIPAQEPGERHRRMARQLIDGVAHEVNFALRYRGVTGGPALDAPVRRAPGARRVRFLGSLGKEDLLGVGLRGCRRQGAGRRRVEPEPDRGRQDRRPDDPSHGGAKTGGHSTGERIFPARGDLPNALLSAHGSKGARSGAGARRAPAR